MTPITRQNILAHQAVVPWSAQYQVEQDLLLCRAMVVLFDDAFLSSQIAMRGGGYHQLGNHPPIQPGIREADRGRPAPARIDNPPPHPPGWRKRGKPLNQRSRDNSRKPISICLYVPFGKVRVQVPAERKNLHVFSILDSFVHWLKGNMVIEPALGRPDVD